MLVQTGSAFERRLKSIFEILLPIGRKRKDVQCPDIEFNLGEWEPIEAFPSIFSRTALPHRIKWKTAGVRGEFSISSIMKSKESVFLKDRGKMSSKFKDASAQNYPKKQLILFLKMNSFNSDKLLIRRINWRAKNIILKPCLISPSPFPSPPIPGERAGWGGILVALFMQRLGLHWSFGG